MSTHYCQLTQAQRYQIGSLLDTQHTLREIGQKIGVHLSTVSRELRRNRSIKGDKPPSAHRQSITRKGSALKSNKLSEKTDNFIR